MLFRKKKKKKSVSIDEIHSNYDWKLPGEKLQLDQKHDYLWTTRTSFSA